MSNNKQTSVEWLISQLQKSKDWHRVLNEISQMSSASVDIIKQAKAMHKEEVENTYNDAISDFRQDQERPLTGAEYYLINYKKNNL